jgi:ApaG protein
MVTTSSAVTRGIRVEVEARYIPERSSPETQRWFFAYRVRLVNEGDVKVQLLSRHWVITDANGHEEEVKGPGVVGAQPVLEPAGEFEYTSFCPLGTPFGSMRGTYQMVTDAGEMFDATIAPFTLAEPLSIN